MPKQFPNQLIFAYGSTVVLLCAAALAQTGKTLTNDDVLAMVNKKLPESVIVSAIKSSPGNYDTSTNELIRLNSAGVTENELNAMLAAAHKESSPPPGAVAAPANVASPSNSKLPVVTVLQGKTSSELKLEKTQLAQTKSKPTSMKSLAGDSAMTQAMQAGI
ncbi:MAG TPA: hypothetical protein VFE01_08610, partial [Terracidiphilus sp.]|nr:hypothetical protein [Terracidiphilus sp.]